MKVGAVVVYTRQSVSDFDRDGRPRGPSLEQQQDAVTSRPEFQGLAVEHFQDANRSGKETSKRPGYLAMMQRLRGAAVGEIVAVACYDQDRLHRNDIAFFAFMAEMEERGIAVYEASGLISDKSKLSWKVKAVVAQDVREQIAKRVKDNLGFLRRQGRLLGTLPVGYRRDASGAIVVVEPIAQVIRIIFEKYSGGGFSFRTLATWMNQQGIKPITTRGGAGKPPARLWSGDVVKEILERPTYAGLLPLPRRGDRTPIVGSHPEIVPLRVWTRCQELRERNRPPKAAGVRPPRHRSSRFPLSPLLRCVACGGPMCGATNGHRGFNARYYVCSDRRRFGTDGCHAPRVRAEVLEAELRTWLAKCQLSEQVEAAARQVVERGLRQRRTVNQDLVERRTVKELEARIQRLTMAWAIHGLNEADFLREKAATEQQLAEARAVPALPTMRQMSARITDLVHAWESASEDQRARLAAAILTEIHVEDQRIVAIRPRPALRPYFEELIETDGRRERETSLGLATSAAHPPQQERPKSVRADRRLIWAATPK